MSEKKKLHIDEIVFTHFLNDGEQLVWKGQPNPNLMGLARDNDINRVMLGLLVFIPLSYLIWGIPGVSEMFTNNCLIPILMIMGLLIYVPTVSLNSISEDSRSNIRDIYTYYAVTTERIFLLRTQNTEKLQTLDIAKLPKMQLGHNHIIFTVIRMNIRSETYKEMSSTQLMKTRV